MRAAKASLAFFNDIPLRQEYNGKKYYGLAYVQADVPPRGTENIEIMGYGVLIEDRKGAGDDTRGHTASCQAVNAGERVSRMSQTRRHP